MASFEFLGLEILWEKKLDIDFEVEPWESALLTKSTMPSFEDPPQKLGGRPQNKQFYLAILVKYGRRKPWEKGDLVKTGWGNSGKRPIFALKY